jgi:FkbM family methyltransferase
MASGVLRAAIANQVSRRFPRLWLERELRFRPHHFERELWLVPIFCNKEKVAIDIGANMGAYSYYMAKYSKSVIAFEPNKDLWAHLRRVLGPNCQLEPAALSARSATAVMRIDKHNTGVATIEESNDLSCVADKSVVISRAVETKTLDGFEIADISLIKIDVEGHEEAVIEGAQETIKRSRPVLIIESEDRHNPGAPRRLADALSGLGYLTFYLKDRRLMEFHTLRNEDTDPNNLTRGGLTYINNFIFIAEEQATTIDHAQAFLSFNPGDCVLNCCAQRVPKDEAGRLNLYNSSPPTRACFTVSMRR